MTSRSGQKGSFSGALVQSSWHKGKERSYLLAFVSPKRNKNLHHGWRAYCELLQKWKVPALWDFLGKRGLTVTGNKELLVNPTVICITAHNIHIAVQCLLLFGGLIKTYLYITSGDLSNIITSLRIVSTITFWRQWSGVGPYQTQGPGSMNLCSWSAFHDFSVVIQIRWKFHAVHIRDLVKWSLWNFAHGTTFVQNCVTIWFPTMKLHLKSSFHRIKITMGKSFMNWAPGVRLNINRCHLTGRSIYTWVLWYWYRIFIMESPIPERWHLINSILSKVANPSHSLP